MTIMEKQGTVSVYDSSGELVYSMPECSEVIKLSTARAVLISDLNMTWVEEIIPEDTKEPELRVLVEEHFVRAFVKDGLVFVERAIPVPVLDIYDSEFNFLVRLHSFAERWYYYLKVFIFFHFRYVPAGAVDGKLFLRRKKDKEGIWVDLVTGKRTSGSLNVNGYKSIELILDEFYYFDSYHSLD